MTKILGIAGSLRKGSFHHALLRAAQERVGDGYDILEGTISGIPLYDADDEAANGLPDAVVTLKNQITSANGLLLVTPEYNHAIPGVFKNAIDWASRTYIEDESQHPLFGKPCALMGAGGGMGTGRSQYHLRQVLVFLNCIPLNKPEVFVQRWNPPDSFDSQGDLKDEKTVGKIDDMLSALAKWTRMIQAGKDIL